MKVILKISQNKFLQSLFVLKYFDNFFGEVSLYQNSKKNLITDKK